MFGRYEFGIGSGKNALRLSTEIMTGFFHTRYRDVMSWFFYRTSKIM